MTLCNTSGFVCIQSCRAASRVFLQPGDWFFGDERYCAATTLGSCVAFTFWHSQRRLGGICHYMLAGRASPKTEAPDGRYADEAITLLSQAAHAQGTRLCDYQVKLFGGADMYGTPNTAQSSVAASNIAMAHELIRRYGLSVAAQSLGGSAYRQIVFNLSSGDVWVRQGPAAPRPAPDAPLTRGAA